MVSLAFGRQRHADLCEFQACLIYREYSMTARVTQGNPASINKSNNNILHTLIQREEERGRERDNKNRKYGKTLIFEMTT